MSLWSILDLILIVNVFVFVCLCIRVYFIWVIFKIEGILFCKLNYYEIEFSIFIELNLFFLLGK